MAILITSEAPDYLPTLAANLNDVQLRLALTEAEAIATGPQGSNRPLGLRQHEETFEMMNSGVRQVRQWPINLTQPVELSLREFAPGGYFGTETWQTIAPERYQLSNKGELVVDAGLAGFFSSTSNFGRRRAFQNYSPTQQVPRMEGRISYWVGFDFREVIPADWETTVAPGPDYDRISQIVMLKTALAEIVRIRQAAKDALAGVGSSTGANELGSTPSGSRATEAEVAGHITVKLSDGAGAARMSTEARTAASSAYADGSMLEETLSIFRRYRAFLPPAGRK